jgi:DNA-binding IscR family transcriptional regulator
LTSVTDFGLHALMRLAGEPQRLITTEGIARAAGLKHNAPHRP